MQLPYWEPLKPHPKQSQAWYTDKKYVILACGRGSGKTLLARRRIVRNLAVTHDLPLAFHAYCLPTYNQARRVAWEALKAMVPKAWVLGQPHEGEMSIRTKMRSILFVAGLDKPQRIEGTQWSSIVLDESCDIKPGTFGRSVLPALTHNCFSCWRIGVPKRQGPGAAEFRAAYSAGVNDPNTFVASWPTSDIVDAAELEDAKSRLDPADYAEQYDAKFGTMGGGVFHCYDETHNVTDRAEYRPGYPIIVMSDFNVDPMCWCLGHFIDGHLYVFDELSLRQTNTRATLDVLYRKYGAHEYGFLFTGDAAAKANKTSADASDYIQIFNDTRFKNKRVVYNSANPSRRTRFSATNAALCNAKGDRRLHIHPRCKVLQGDLRDRAYAQGTMEPDDSQFVGHMSDALGYGVMLLMPLAVEHNEMPKVYTR